MDRRSLILHELGLTRWVLRSAGNDPHAVAAGAVPRTVAPPPATGAPPT